MAIIECPPDLDIATAGTLHRQLLAGLKSREPMAIDGKAVRKVHTAALQLFLSLVVEAHLHQIPVQWRDPSSALIEAAQLLGLTDSLGLGETGHGAAD